MQKPSQNLKISTKRVVEIEKGDIRRFSEAVFAQDPIHNELDAAKKAGFTGLVAPPTFCATLGNHHEILQQMELNPRQIFHSEQQLHELETVCSGDSLTIQSNLIDQYEKTSGSTNTGFVVIEDVGTNQKNKKVFVARRTYAIRGGFPRR